MGEGNSVPHGEKSEFIEQEQEVGLRGDKGVVGRPNGKTERRKKLRHMTKTQRREYRLSWKMAQKKFSRSQRDARRSRVRSAVTSKPPKTETKQAA